jgi:hypothetical protein
VPRTLRLWSLLLVPLGFAAGHELGYQAAAALGAPSVIAGGHDYVVAVVLIAAPFAVAATARSALAGLRDELPPVSLRTLLGGQAALFAAVELGEHVTAGLSPPETLAQPAVLLGLIAQLLVAALLVAVLATSRRAAAVVAAGRRRPVARRPVWRPTAAGPAAIVPAVVPVTTLSRRGPPALRVR